MESRTLGALGPDKSSHPLYMNGASRPIRQEWHLEPEEQGGMLLGVPGLVERQCSEWRKRDGMLLQSVPPLYRGSVCLYCPLLPSPATHSYMGPGHPGSTILELVVFALCGLHIRHVSDL